MVFGIEPLADSMDAALPVEVREIEPGTVHSDPRRTRHVRLRVEDGPLVRVYDPRGVVTPDAVGDRRTVELAAVVATVETTSRQRGHVDVEAGERPVFQGPVVTFDGEGEQALLDVGVGTVRFDTVTVDRRVHVGDFVRVTGAVVHVEGMTPGGRSQGAFVGRLQGDDAADRRSAARYLGHCGDETAVDPLVECYRREREPAVREAVVAALGRLALSTRRPDEAPNPRVRSTLEAATGDEAAIVRETADEWLGRVTDYWRDP